MKALIRNHGEIVTEDKGIDGINWDDGAPLTNSQMCGGPYTLVEDYTPSTEDEENNECDLNEKRKAEIAELRARLANLENGV